MSRADIRSRAAGSFMLLATMAPTGTSAEGMPDDFVYLRAVEPSILQDIRYAGSGNFTGARVPGYKAAECVLVRQAAEALKAAQGELRSKGLSLKVFDCYRPARAVRAFVDWAKRPDDPGAKAFYYPSLAKSALFPDYIATMSGHSRGATVDLTIVPVGEATANAPARDGKAACTAVSDGSIDMGTSFDCFDVKANTDTSDLTPEQRRSRQMLVEIMARHGFKNYDKEWWHYTLANEPYPDRIFDFPITPRQ